MDCARLHAQASKKKHEAAPHQEDLSLVRPAIPLQNENRQNAIVSPAREPQAYDNKQVVRLSDSMALNYQRFETMAGYRILIYSGGSSEQAFKIKQQFYEAFPDIPAYSIYKQPSFRVLVGNYIDRVDAYYYLSDIRAAFPNAMIIPDKIKITND
jgi:hypothetical protein